MTTSQLIEVDFHGITITVPNVRDADEAYATLCTVLQDAGFEFATDTFQECPHLSSEPNREGQTSELTTWRRFE